MAKKVSASKQHSGERMHSSFNDKVRNRLRVGRSYAGRGLFAKSGFRKGQRVVEYIGYKVPNKVIEDMPGDNRYLFDLNKRFTINGAPYFNLARWANHSCEPNTESTEWGSKIYLVALRHIERGEEITWDYGKEYFDEYIGTGKCKCNACRAKRA